MSTKTFYVALYMLEFETKTDNFVKDSIITKFISVFEKDEQLFALNFVNDLGLVDLITYRWNTAFFFIFLGNQTLVKNWSVKLEFSLKNLVKKLLSNTEYECFSLTNYTYLHTSNSRRLGSVGGALRRIILIIRDKMEPQALENNRVGLSSNNYNNGINNLHLCTILNGSLEKRQKIEEVFSSVTENRKVPQLDLRYYTLFKKKQEILNKLELIADEKTSNNNKDLSNKRLKGELKELVASI